MLHMVPHWLRNEACQALAVLIPGLAVLTKKNKNKSIIMTVIPTKRRHGPAPRPVSQQRRKRINVFLTEAEHQLIEEKAGDFDVPEFLRNSALEAQYAPRVPSIPKLNFEAWKKLSRVANNINQIARRLNVGQNVSLHEVLKALGDFRLALLAGGLQAAVLDDEIEEPGQ